MIGETVSHYKIVEKLGEGAMGVVYRAEDTKLKRTVALKFLPKELTRDQEARERFLREARAAAALDHQNICAVHEIDETEDDQVFIAMACYEGETLSQKIALAPLDLDDAIDIAVQTAKGLGKAHEKNILHRDIKPANIIITGDGVVKIIDFGLARLRGGDTRLTSAGTTMGTASYMSPEQAQGADVDHRSDIWSLGVIIYQMISGQLPFKGDHQLGVLYAIVNKKPQPLTALRTGVPAELERIVNKTLAKDPSQRYQHTDDLIADLKKLKRETEPELIAGPKSTVIEPAKRPARVYLRAGIVFLAVIIAAAAYFIFKDKWKNSIAVLPFVDLSPQKDQEYFCDGMTDDIITKLTRFGALKVISRTSVMRYKDTAKDIKTIGKELGVAAILEGSIRKEKNNIRVTAQLINIQDGFHLWADTFDRELESVFDVQDEVSNAIAEALQVKLSPGIPKSQEVSRPKDIEAYEYCLKGMHILDSRYIIYEREEDFQAAIKMFKKALEIDPNYVRSYFGLGYAYELHWEFTGKKEEDLDKMITVVKKAYRMFPDSMLSIQGMAWINFRQGNYDKAYRYFKRAQKVAPEISVSKINHGMGFFLASQGLYRRAVKYFSREVELDPFYLYAQQWLGNCFAYLGEFEKAVIHYKKAMEISPNDVYSMGRYAKFLIMMKKYGEAGEVLARAEKIDPDYLWLPFWNALLPAAMGEKEKALALYNKDDWEGLQIYSLLDMKQAADRTLNKLAENDYEFDYLFLIHNPCFDNLRDTPRFKEIVKKAKQVYEERLRKYGDL